MLNDNYDVVNSQLGYGSVLYWIARDSDDDKWQDVRIMQASTMI